MESSRISRVCRGRGSCGGSGLEQRPELRDAQQQHERLAFGERPEAETATERLRAIVEGLDHDRPRTDELGGRQDTFRGIDQQIGAEPTPLVAGVDRELSEQNHRHGLGHASADPRRHPPPLHRARGEAVERDNPGAAAGDIGTCAPLGLV